MRKSTKNKILLVVGIIAILLGGYLVKVRQVRFSRALSPSGEGDIKLITEETTDGNKRVKILFRTGQTAESVLPVSTVTVKLKVTGSEDTKIVNFLGNDIRKLLTNDQMKRDGWSFPVNNVTEDDNNYGIELAAVNKTINGYSSFNYQELATFYLKGSGRELIEIDNELSHIYTKTRPVIDIVR